MGAARPFLIVLMIVPVLMVAAPSAAAAACELNPCIGADWHGCGQSPPNPTTCSHTCYTVHQDPPAPDHFWYSYTFCVPMLGDDNMT